MTRARAGVLLVVAATGLLTLGAIRLVQAATALRAAEDAVDVAEEALAGGRLAVARGALVDAGDEIHRANEALQTSVSLDVLGALPVVDENLAALVDSVELVAAVVHGGERILAAASPLEGPDGTLEVSLSDGSVPVDRIDDALEEIRALRTRLPDRPSPPLSQLVLPPVRDAHRTVRAEVVDRRLALDRLDRGLTLLRELVGADRPTRYLLAVANTAEMRGTGGMILNYGVLEGRDGVVDLVDFGRIGELRLPAPVAPDQVGLPSDFQRRWATFAPTREWRNSTVGADFTVAAPVLRAMFQRATGLPVDGVLQIDPSALAALLRVIGPVEVPELGSVAGDQVEALVLHDAYRRFPGVEERTDVLGDVAEAAFRRLVDGDFPSVADLAEAVVEAVDGRHLLAHSADAEVQDAVRWFGATGGLPPAEAGDAVHVTVQNMAGNKLDWYLDTAVRIEGVRTPAAVGRMQVTLTMTNTAPPGETTPRYIFGPIDGDQRAGLYRGAVSVYLPRGTSLAGAAGGPFRIPPALDTEDGRPVVGAWVDVPAGESRTVELDLRLAPAGDEPYRLVLVPSPRIRPTVASVAVEAPGGTVTGDVVLDRTWVLGPRGASALSAASSTAGRWHER